MKFNYDSSTHFLMRLNKFYLFINVGHLYWSGFSFLATRVWRRLDMILQWRHESLDRITDPEHWNCILRKEKTFQNSFPESIFRRTFSKVLQEQGFLTFEHWDTVSWCQGLSTIHALILFIQLWVASNMGFIWRNLDDYFWPLLKRASPFEAAGAVAKVGSIIKLYHHEQI